MTEKQAMEELGRVNAEVIEASKRSAADAERRAQDLRAQIDQQNRQLDDQRKEAEKIRSGEIKNLENEMAVERQRAKDQQDRAEAERLSLANEHRDRMKGNTEEFNGQVKRIEDADIRDAQEHKEERDRMEREANATRKDLNDAQIRQVEERKKGFDVQRNLHLSEYQRKVENKKENQKQYQIEQNEATNQLVAEKAKNQVEQSSQLLNQIRSRIDLIGISTQAAAQGAHEFVYKDSMANCARRAIECENNCSSIITQMDGLIKTLTAASEPKGLMDKVQFWQPDVNKPKVDKAANHVINSCDTAMKAVDALSSACSTGDSTIQLSASGISAEKRKEYLEHINGLSDICKQLKQLVSKAKLSAKLRSSVKDIEDLKEKLEGEIDRLTKAMRELPMLDHENKLEGALEKLKKSIKHSTEEVHSRNEKAELELKSQMQSSIQGAADTQMQGQEREDDPDEHAHQD